WWPFTKRFSQDQAESPESLPHDEARKRLEHSAYRQVLSAVCRRYGNSFGGPRRQFEAVCECSRDRCEYGEAQRHPTHGRRDRTPSVNDRVPGRCTNITEHRSRHHTCTDASSSLSLPECVMSADV